MNQDKTPARKAREKSATRTPADDETAIAAKQVARALSSRIAGKAAGPTLVIGLRSAPRHLNSPTVSSCPNWAIIWTCFPIR
jgi:hypothetical protein